VAVIPKKSADASFRHRPRWEPLSDAQAATIASRETPIVEQLEQAEERAIALARVAGVVPRLTPRQQKAFVAWWQRLQVGHGRFNKKAKYEATRKLRKLVR